MYQEFNRLRDDLCDQQQRFDSNAKKLKFITTNHRDLIDSRSDGNFFSIQLSDGVNVPPQQIDGESVLKYADLTQLNCRQGLDMLPVQMGSKYPTAHGDTVIEDQMRNEYTRTKRSCQPIDCAFYERSFGIFETVEVPDALKSVETRDAFRGGVQTRFADIKSIEQVKKEYAVKRNTTPFSPVANSLKRKSYTTQWSPMV